MIDWINRVWLKMNICEQLGNVGSEVGRAVNWNNKGNIKNRNKALERGLELLDLTINDPRWQNHRQKELKMAREVLADTFLGDGIYGDTPEKLEKYFFQFAFAARNNK